MRVEAIFAIGDFQGANGSPDAQELAEVLAGSAGGGSPPGVADLRQERGQIIAQPMGDGEGQQLDVHPHRLRQGHSGDEFGATPFADLGCADRAGPDGGADDQTGVERLAVLDAAMHLERLLGDTPTAALGGAGGRQQAVDHAFQGKALGAVPFRVLGGVEDFAGFFIDLKTAC